MKRNLMLMFLFLSALMLSSAGNVSNASALGNYYCNTIPLSNTHIDCLRGLLDQHAPHLNVPRGARGLGYYKCDIPDSNTWRHVNCLRASLDRNAPGLAAMRGGSNNIMGAPRGSAMAPYAPHRPDNSNEQGAAGSSYHLNQPVNQGGVNGVLPGPR